MHKVIYDTDPGVDDAMALLFLHRHPEIDLIGITTIFGNASIETTTRNALFLKREWNIAAPVAKGANVTFDPSRKEIGWPTFVHGDDGHGNIGVPETIDHPTDPRLPTLFLGSVLRFRLDHHFSPKRLLSSGSYATGPLNPLRETALAHFHGLLRQAYGDGALQAVVGFEGRGELGVA